MGLDVALGPKFGEPCSKVRAPFVIGGCLAVHVTADVISRDTHWVISVIRTDMGGGGSGTSTMIRFSIQQSQPPSPSHEDLIMAQMSPPSINNEKISYNVIAGSHLIT